MNTTPFRKFVPLALLGLGFAACQPDIEDDYVASKGSADFSRYIAVGNSLTAGYSDGGLYLEGQLSSYPNLLAMQFKNVGGGDFTQPLFTQQQSNGSGYLRLAGFTATGNPITANVTTNLAVRSASPVLYTRFDTPVNNLGVPGIRLADIQTAGYGSVAGNPYFERITPTTNPLQTYFQRVKAEAATATFFSNWLGNNDVLGYATSGGASTAASSQLTRTDTFTLKYNRIINALTEKGAKGIVATIPDVTTIPFFTTVGPTFKTTLQSLQVAGLVVQTGAAPGGPSSSNRKTVTTADIRDASGNGRQLFTLTSSPFLSLFGQPTGRAWRYIYGQSGQPAAGFPTFLAAYGVDTLKAFGSADNPIPSAFVLDDSEQNTIRTTLAAFNTTIRNKAAEKGLALFDANAFFTTVSNGSFVTNNISNTTAYISGNLFSLDGVHPTPRGYAIIANEMVRAINTTYGSTIPLLNAGNYRGVKFP